MQTRWDFSNPLLLSHFLAFDPGSQSPRALAVASLYIIIENVYFHLSFASWRRFVVSKFNYARFKGATFGPLATTAYV
jgi:hypothetical protein